MSQTPVHRFPVRHGDEKRSMRRQKLPIARQYLGRIVDMLEYETHDDHVEALVAFEALEIRLDDLGAAVRICLAEIGDDGGRTLEHDVPGHGARETSGRVAVTEAE